MSKKTNEIRKRFKVAEERKGEPLTVAEKRKIEKRVVAKYRRENLIRGAFLALGITIGAGSHALLTEGKNNQENKQKIEAEIDTENSLDNTQIESNTEHQNFVKGLEVKTEELETIEQENGDEGANYQEIIDEIIKEYNEKNGEELTKDDISFMRSIPAFLGVDSDGKIIQDYKQNTPVEKYITDGIGYIYVMLNSNDNSVISSLGKVSGKLENIDTKVIMNSDREEYFESDKKIDLTENQDKETILKRYNALQYEYQKEKEENKEEKEF